MARRNNSTRNELLELRRKHAEYRAAQQAAENAKAEIETLADPVVADNEVPAAEPIAAAEAPVEEKQAASYAAEAPAAALDVNSVPDEETDTDIQTEYEAEDSYENAEDGYEADEDELDDDDGNLFTPLIKAAKSLIGKISSKRGDAEELDDEYPNEEDISGDESEPADDEFSDDAEPEKEKKSFFSFLRRRKAEDEFDEFEDEDEFADEADPETDEVISKEPEAIGFVEAPAAEVSADIDIPQELSVDTPADVDIPQEPAVEIPSDIDIPQEPAVELPADIDIPHVDEPMTEVDRYEDEDGEDEYIADDEEYDEDIEEYADDSVKPGIGKKILDFFFVVTPDDTIDEDDYEISDPEYDDDEPEEEGFDDSLFVNDHRPIKSEEDLIYMEEQKKLGTLSDLMSEGMDEKILSRRERRELRMKQEAEQAAANAAENNTAEVEEPAAPIAPVEPEAEETSVTADEPTREYRIVSRPAEFRIIEDEDDYDEDDDEDDDYEYEETPKKRGKSLFGKKSRVDDEDDYDDDFDDEDDFDDDYDDYDDDEDDYEPVKRKKTRKASRYDDDYDDYDDEDDYDDYDDDSPSVGHYVLGFIKYVIAIVLILVVVVFGMYFADQAIEGGFAPYRFITEKVPFIAEYLPASDDAAPAAATKDATVTDDAAAPEITEEPSVEIPNFEGTSSIENEEAPAEGEGDTEATPAPVG